MRRFHTGVCSSRRITSIFDIVCTRVVTGYREAMLNLLNLLSLKRLPLLSQFHIVNIVSYRALLGLCPAISCLAFSCPAHWSVIFTCSIFNAGDFEQTQFGLLKRKRCVAFIGSWLVVAGV